MFRLAAFIHHDVGVTRSRRLHRHHGRTSISGNRDRQRAVRRVAVRINAAVIEDKIGQTVLWHIVVGLQREGVGAFFRKRQRAYLLAVQHHLVAIQRIFTAVGQPLPFHMAKSVSTGIVVGGHIAAGHGVRPFRHRGSIRHQHRHVVMHGDTDVTGGRIARGVRHQDRELARQGLVRRRIVSAMLLATTQFIAIAHRPLAIHKLGMHVGKRHAMHGLCFAAGRSFTSGYGDREAAHFNRTVLTLQVHDERAVAALAMACTTVFRLAAFIHHDVGVARSRSIHRHHGHVLITLDGDGQRRFRRIAVRILDGVGELFRVRLAIRHVHTGGQRVGVGAVRIQRQRAVGAVHGLAGIATVDRGNRLVRGGVRAEHVVVQHVCTAAARLRLRFRQRDVIGTGHRPVVPDGQIQSDLGTGTVAVAVRHRQLHADAVERQDIIGIAVVGMNQGTVIFQGKGDIALAVDMHIEDFRITGHADDTAFIIDGQYDRHHLATDEGNKGILRAGIQREFIAAADFTVRTGDDSEVVADIHDILNTCTMKIAFIQLQLRLTSRRHLHGVIFHLDLKLHLA